jgi:hypothetical protein
MDLSDSGFASRKLWMSVGCIGIIFVAALLCGFFSSMVPVYTEFVTGTIAIYGLYVAGNVSNKYFVGKVLSAATSKEPLAPAEKSDSEAGNQS